MIDPNDARFSSEILSLTTANPGWQVHIEQRVTDPETRKTEVEEEDWFPVVAWALVKRVYVDGQTVNETEPVFSDNGRLVHSTEYRRLHSDLDPAPGQPKIRISIAVESPAEAEVRQG
ncbi:hypothetical protein ACIP4S_33095 [Streptomyces chartreusis]|uniref:hypothetical protein n=1 Tax=Streptomyces chartreusis TaxID=1969 RepID=UPI003800D5B3